MPLDAVVTAIVGGSVCPNGLSNNNDGGLGMDGDAENREPEHSVDDVVIERG